MNRSFAVLPSRRGQRGISLIIAMVMLVVIGLVSVSVIRNTTSVDRVVNNNRLQTQANQFAQLALRFCENQVQLSTSNKQLAAFQILSPGSWSVTSNWFDATKTYTLKTGDITGTVQPAHPPECMAETSSVASNIWLVTARGFSDDWAEDPTSHATTNGSVVWLQSNIAM